MKPENKAKETKVVEVKTPAQSREMLVALRERHKKDLFWAVTLDVIGEGVIEKIPFIGPLTALGTTVGELKSEEKKRDKFKKEAAPVVNYLLDRLEGNKKSKVVLLAVADLVGIETKDKSNSFLRDMAKVLGNEVSKKVSLGVNTLLDRGLPGVSAVSIGELTRLALLYAMISAHNQVLQAEETHALEETFLDKAIDKAVKFATKAQKKALELKDLSQEKLQEALQKMQGGFATVPGAA